MLLQRGLQPDTALVLCVWFCLLLLLFLCCVNSRCFGSVLGQQRRTCTRSWFVVLEQLPRSSSSNLDLTVEEQNKHDITVCSLRTPKCSMVGRRVMLWICGVITTILELGGLVTLAQLPDFTVFGFTLPTVMHFALVFIWLFVMIAWGIAGIIFLRSLRKIGEVAPKARSLMRLLGTHLTILVVTYFVFVVLGVLYPFFLAKNPYVFAVTISLHRLCEFLFAFSMLRMIDGRGDAYVA